MIYKSAQTCRQVLRLDWCRATTSSQRQHRQGSLAPARSAGNASATPAPVYLGKL